MSGKVSQKPPCCQVSTVILSKCEDGFVLVPRFQITCLEKLGPQVAAPKHGSPIERNTQT